MAYITVIESSSLADESIEEPNSYWVTTQNTHHNHPSPWSWPLRQAFSNNLPIPQWMFEFFNLIQFHMLLKIIPHIRVKQKYITFICWTESCLFFLGFFKRKLTFHPVDGWKELGRWSWIFTGWMKCHPLNESLILTHLLGKWKFSFHPLVNFSSTHWINIQFHLSNWWKHYLYLAFGQNI